MCVSKKKQNEIFLIFYSKVEFTSIELDFLWTVHNFLGDLYYISQNDIDVYYVKRYTSSSCVAYTFSHFRNTFHFTQSSD